MDFDRLNRWLTLLANIGVAIGLILLIVELRQNQEMIELEYNLSLVDADQTEIEYLASLRLPRIVDPELAQLWLDGREARLTDGLDKQRYGDMCNLDQWAVAMMYRRSKLLGRDARAEGAVESMARAIIASPGIRECWESMRFELWGWPEWREAVETALQAKSAN